MQLWQRRRWLMCCTGDLGDSEKVKRRKTSSLQFHTCISLPRELSERTVEKWAGLILCAENKVISRRPRVNMSFTIPTSRPFTSNSLGSLLQFKQFVFLFCCSDSTGAVTFLTLKQLFCSICVGCWVRWQMITLTSPFWHNWINVTQGLFLEISVVVEQMD